MQRTLPLLALLAVLAAGCGGETTRTVVVTETVVETRPPDETIALRVYFLRAGRVAAAAREVSHTVQVGAAALRALLEGPTADEEDFGLESALVPETVLRGLSIDEGVARPDLRGALSREAVAQVVYTLTQFPSVRAVDLGVGRYTRASFEDLTPAILVESPAPGEVVRSPLRARGTANTFEATFEYDLVDPEGKIVAHDFVTATSGSGVRGTFDFTVPFRVDRSGLGALVVFERSAADGSRIHIVEIPIRLER